MSSNAEQIFARILKRKGIDFIYQPKPAFHMNYLGATITYRPDFYIPSEDTYYEVVGTRQAFHANKEKLFLMFALRPEIKFRIVKGNKEDCIDHDKFRIQAIHFVRSQAPLPQKVFRDGFMSTGEVCELLKLDYQSVYALVRIGQIPCVKIKRAKCTIHRFRREEIEQWIKDYQVRLPSNGNQIN